MTSERSCVCAEICRRSWPICAAVHCGCVGEAMGGGCKAGFCWGCGSLPGVNALVVVKVGVGPTLEGLGAAGSNGRAKERAFPALAGCGAGRGSLAGAAAESVRLATTTAWGCSAGSWRTCSSRCCLHARIKHCDSGGGYHNCYGSGQWRFPESSVRFPQLRQGQIPNWCPGRAIIGMDTHARQEILEERFSEKACIPVAQGCGPCCYLQLTPTNRAA